ncbi:MAG: SpoIIE family protein phosphatase [Burkholderiales bacterium]
MSPPADASRSLSTADLEAILRVTRALAAPFDLPAMLAAVVDAAKQVLHAERGSVWLHEPRTDELVLEVATGLAPVRVRSGAGLVGACARSREIINVPDCYADPRFDPGVDRASGYRTRCMLTLPLVDHQDRLVGVMQVLNKANGVFDAYDENLASALAAQCAVALQRVRMTEALIEGERMRRSLEMAREVQMSTLPARMPEVAGYDLAGAFRPAELTGGDTYDLSLTDGRLLVVLGDATGHGIAPALSVTQMHAMLRIALRLGADLETAYARVNDRLAETLADDRFITAFIGLLDPATHTLRFLSGGQGPIFVYRASTGVFDLHKPTCFPLGAMALSAPRRAVSVELGPGDILVVLSDGYYEYENGAGEAFGEARVRAIVAEHRHEPADHLLARIEAAVGLHAAGAPQADDMTGVIVRREPAGLVRRGFPRGYESIPALVEHTAAYAAEHGVDAALLATVDLAIEELFTNMVKYSRSAAAEVRLDLLAVDGGIEVTLVDSDVDAFDPTQAPDVDTSLPIERRRPGGLGLHLVRKLVADYRYDYAKAARRSTIAFRVLRPPPAGAATPGG